MFQTKNFSIYMLQSIIVLNHKLNLSIYNYIYIYVYMCIYLFLSMAPDMQLLVAYTQLPQRLWIFYNYQVIFNSLTQCLVYSRESQMTWSGYIQTTELHSKSLLLNVNIADCLPCGLHGIFFRSLNVLLQSPKKGALT